MRTATPAIRMNRTAISKASIAPLPSSGEKPRCRSMKSNIFPAPAIDPFGVGAGSVDATLGQVKFQSGKIPEGEYPNLRDRLSELGQ